MNGVEIKKTYPSDFEKIYPLLREFNSPFAKEDWKRIFFYAWDKAEDYIGFHLEHEGNVVGFMGLIFSYRVLNDSKYKFCNISSWIVKKEFRAATALLVRKLKSLKDTILTGLSPIEDSYRLLTLIGFTPFEKSYRILPTINYLMGSKINFEIFEMPKLFDHLDEEQKRIVKDHHNLKCKSILFTFNNITILLLYTITNQNYKKIPLKKIHLLYISDIEQFNKYMHSVLKYFYKRFGILSAIYLDNRFLQKRHSIFSFEKHINPPRIFHCPFNNRIDVDELYSEAVLL